MQDPYATYKTKQSNGWTRINMLLALYDAAIQRIQATLDAIESGDVSLAVRNRLKSQRIVLEILSGIDLGHGEFPARIQQLCLFVIECLQNEDTEKISAAQRIMQTLREGFAGIQAEAVALENQGVIPPCADMPVLDTTIS